MKQISMPLCVAAVLVTTAYAQVELAQTISRENPAFKCRTAVMTVGRDGRIYLTNQDNPGCVLRFERAGSGKKSGSVVYAMGNATANRDGVIATANAHFAHALNLYDAEFRQTFANSDFLVSDATGWDAPFAVEAGENSGDFYAVDQHRNRVLRVDSQGRTVTSYPVFEISTESKRSRGFRVCEKEESFYWLQEDSSIRASDWSGKTRWIYRHPDGLGSFDVDTQGNVYVLGPADDKGVILDRSGSPPANSTCVRRAKAGGWRASYVTTCV